MAIVKVTKGKKSGRVLRYALDGKAKDNANGVVDRVLAFSSNNVYGQDSELLEGQFAVLRERSGKSDKVTQSHHVIQSFAKDEFDYNNSDDVAKANALGLELAKAISPDVQAVVVTQADNKAGVVHNHIILSSIMLDGRSLPTNNVGVYHVRGVNDAVMMSNGFNIHANIGKGRSGYDTPAEQGLRDRHVKTDTDIIKERLNNAIEVSSSFNSLSKNLALVGITPVKGKRKGNDIIKFKLNADKKAYTDRKLGEAFSLDSIQSRLSQNQAKYATISSGSIVRKTSAFSTYAKQQGIAEVPSVDLSYFANNKIIQDKKETKTQPELTPKPRHKIKSVQSEVASSASEEQTNVETSEEYVDDMAHFVDIDWYAGINFDISDSDINRYDGMFEKKEKEFMQPKQHVEPPKRLVSYSDGDSDFYTEMLLEDQEASKNRRVAKPKPKQKQKHKEDGFEL